MSRSLTNRPRRRRSARSTARRCTGNVRWLWRCGVGLLWLSMGPFAGHAEEVPAGTSESPALLAAADAPWIQTLADQASDSIVMITVEGRDGRQDGLGTGFVLSDDGLIGTNLHVIGEARPITVRFRNGKSYPVTEIFATDRQLDLAIVRIAAETLKPLPLAAADRVVTAGEPILVLGNPMGLRHSVVSGVISGTREIDGRQMLQIALPIEPGNSGGPVLSRTGEVVGLVTLKSAVTANLGFAVQATALTSLLERPNPILMERWETIGSLDSHEWTTVFGARWRSRSGQIVASESGDSFGGRALCLAKTPPPAVPFEVGAFVRLDDEAGAAGLVFAADGRDRHYGFYPSAGRLRLTRFEGPTVYSWQILAELASEHYHPRDWNHLKVRVSDDKLQCFVNDQPVLEWPLTAPLQGQVGLAKFRDTQARFKRFEIAAQLAPSQLADERLSPLRTTLSNTPWEQLTTAEGLQPFVDDPEAGRLALQQHAARLREQADRTTRLADDIHVQDTVQQLVRLFENEASELRLAHAGLLISRLDNPELDATSYLQQIRQMAHAVREAAGAEATPTARLEALNRYLFTQNGFHGSRTNYYQAANSYLDRVLDDREGLPITLAILYLELGRQLELDLAGIGLPGHFIVRFHPPGADRQYVDVFSRGELLKLEEINRLVMQSTETVLDDADLVPMTDRAIALRVLRNLEGIAQRNQQSEALLRYLEAMVALAPDEPALRGMRAVIRQETGRRQAALADLDWFLAHQPEGIDLDTIRALKERFSATPE